MRVLTSMFLVLGACQEPGPDAASVFGTLQPLPFQHDGSLDKWGPLAYDITLTATPLSPGATSTLEATGDIQVGDTVWFVLSTQGASSGGGPCHPSLGLDCLDVHAPISMIDQVSATVAGHAETTLTVPNMPGLVGMTVHLQAFVPAGPNSVGSRAIPEVIQHAADVYCPDDPDPDYTVAIDPSCTTSPVLQTFEPVVEWNWNANPIESGFHQVMMTPVVSPLQDTNGDGTVDDSDVPAIVFTTFATGSAYWLPGSLVAITGDGGNTLFSVDNLGGFLPMSSGGVAVGDLDGDGFPVIAVTTETGVALVDRFGDLIWHQTVTTDRYDAPSFGDLDGDGLAEIIMGRTVLDLNGNILWIGADGTGAGSTRFYTSYSVDMDNITDPADPAYGQQEVVAGNTVYNNDGTTRWATGEDGSSAVADFDADGLPEVVVIDMWVGGDVRLLDNDGTLLWSTPLLEPNSGGPPTVADFDGDGLPEIGFGGTSLYTLLDSDGTLMWTAPIDDGSSACVSSSAFDFDGDGVFEIVFADEHSLWIFDGATGAVRMEYTDHNSGTAWEYPLIVDVDGDGSTELVFSSNDYFWGSTTGITVLSDAADWWQPGRTAWNQHAYSVNNVLPSGRIPAVPASNIDNYNNFRAGNKGIGSLGEQADLTIGTIDICTEPCETEGSVYIYVPVENQGTGPSTPTDLDVRDGTGALIASMFVGPIQPGEMVWIGPIEIDTSSFVGVEIAVDTGMIIAPNAECDETNNTAQILEDPCGVLCPPPPVEGYFDDYIACELCPAGLPAPLGCDPKLGASAPDLPELHSLTIEDACIECALEVIGGDVYGTPGGFRIDKWLSVYNGGLTDAGPFTVTVTDLYGAGGVLFEEDYIGLPSGEWIWVGPISPDSDLLWPDSDGDGLIDGTCLYGAVSIDSADEVEECNEANNGSPALGGTGYISFCECIG